MHVINSNSAWQAGWHRIVDVGICALLMIAPLLMGGRHPVGKFVVCAMVWAITLAGQMEKFQRPLRQRAGPIDWILIAASLLMLCQIVPLPDTVRLWLSPVQQHWLPLWHDPGPEGLGRWQTVSLTPERTRQGCCLFLAYCALFVTIRRRVQTLDDVQRLLGIVAIAIVLMALLGIVQYLFGNGRFLWIYEHPTRNTLYTVKGPFANQNHFVHFLALGIGPLIALIAWRARQRVSRKYEFSISGRPRENESTALFLSIVGLGIVGLAVLLSFSRGGLLVTAMTVTMTLALLAYHRLISGKACFAVFALVGVLGIAVAIHGHQRFAERIGTLTAGGIERIDEHSARRRIWTAVSAAIPNVLRFGAGVGSHREVYPMFMENDAEIEYTHAENGYLQVLLETGLPGLALLLMTAGLSGYWLMVTFRSTRSRQAIALTIAISSGWLASLLHACIDFVWYIPACATVTIVLLAAAERTYHIGLNQHGLQSRTIQVPRSQYIAGTAIMVTIATVCLQFQWHPAHAAQDWDRYFKLSLTEQQNQQQAEWDVAANPPEEGNSRHREQSVAVDRMSELLQRVLNRNPFDGRAHLRLASVCLQRFELAQQQSDNPMPLSSIRAAAVASGFTSRSEQEAWLKRATGPHWRLLDQARHHARCALRLCPLQGKAYLHLADLVFLDGRASVRAKLIDQALAVRPHDGSVLYTVGYEQLQHGKTREAMQYYRRAFHQDAKIQRMIIQSLAAQLGGSAMLELFQPGRTGAKRLLEFYKAAGREQDAQLVANHYVQQVEAAAIAASGPDAASLWFEAQAIHGYRKQVSKAWQAARQALYANPNDYRARYVFAVRSLQMGKRRRALEAFRWCQRQRPGDRTLASKIARLTVAMQDDRDRLLQQ